VQTALGDRADMYRKLFSGVALLDQDHSSPRQGRRSWARLGLANAMTALMGGTALHQNRAGLHFAQCRSRESWRRLTTVALALSIVSGAQAAPGEVRQRAGTGSPAAAWLTPEHADLLRRSYVRCHYGRAKDAGMKASHARSAKSFANDLDVLSGEISNQDIVEAPKETRAGSAHIACRWFGPLIPP
jgi:hypothetical protein